MRFHKHFYFNDIVYAYSNILSISNGLKYLGGSVTLEYQSNNQLGVNTIIEIPDLKQCYGVVASVNYASYNPQAIQKVDRVCPWLEEVNASKKLYIFAYSDDNDFVLGDTITVSWLLYYK